MEILIASDGPVCVRSLIEASVHLPRRSSRWVATFRDATGRQVWRSTGSRSRRAALALARQWEEEARRKRTTQGGLSRKPVIRVRHGSGERDAGLLTQREVAIILNISERAVREIERRAFQKLSRHPALRAFWREHETGEIQEKAAPVLRPWALSRAEVAAVYALARTPAERRVLEKFLGIAQGTIPGRAVRQDCAFG